MSSNQEHGMENCSMIKAFLIVSVVVSHCSAIWSKNQWFIFAAELSPFLYALNEWTSSFHIYCFVLVSGYIYHYLRFEKNKYEEILPFFKKKSLRLLVPYIVVSVFWAIPFYCFFYKSCFKDVVVNFFLGVSPSQLWFLLMLFWVFVIERLLFDKIDNYRIRILLSLCLYGVGILGNHFFLNYFQLFNGLKFYVFFLIGMIIRKKEMKINSILLLLFCIVIHLILIVLKMNYSFGDSYFSKFLSIAFEFLLHLVGSITVFFVSCFVLSKSPKLHLSFVRALSDYSFQVFLFHQQIIWLILYLLINTVSPIMLFLISFVLSISISILISALCSKFYISRITLGIIVVNDSKNANS